MCNDVFGERSPRTHVLLIHKLTKTHYCAFCLVILIPEVAKQQHNHTTQTLKVQLQQPRTNASHIIIHSTQEGVHYYWCICCLQLGPMYAKVTPCLPAHHHYHQS